MELFEISLGDFAAIGAIITAIVAIATLRAQVRAIDTSNYLVILEKIISGEKKVASSTSDDATWQRELRWHFNFLEGLCHLYNSKRVVGKTRELCRDCLINHLAVISSNDAALNLMGGSIITEVTFLEIARFAKNNRVLINNRTKSFR